jgi:hypothetical protein
MTTTSQSSKTRRTATKRRTRKTASASAAVDGVEPLVDALDSEIRLRVSTSTVVAVGIIVILLVLTAAVSANWLFALVTIVLAFTAGWLTTRSSARPT